MKAIYEKVNVEYKKYLIFYLVIRKINKRIQNYSHIHEFR